MQTSEEAQGGNRSHLAMVISGFPGIGKSTFARSQPKLAIIDCNSEQFGWSDLNKRIRNPEWPKNFADFVISKLHQADMICISSHPEVRDALIQQGVHIFLVYPDVAQKEEYLSRYRNRGNSEEYVKRMGEKFKEWIDGMKQQRGGTHIVLGNGEYFSEIADRIIQRKEQQQGC